MKPPRSFKIAIVIAATVACIAAFSIYNLLGANATLSSLQEIQPGDNISVVRTKLGAEWNSITNVDHMAYLGSVTNSTFCQDKTLYMFLVNRYTSQVLDVYTDTNGGVIWATWRQL